jgi:hypothetical protein
MNYKIVRLTPGAAYHGRFFARLEFGGPDLESGVLDFTNARRWFETNFGDGCDLSKVTWGGGSRADCANDTTPKWAWMSAYHDYRIYVQDGPALGWFVLSHKYPVDQ